MEGQGGQGGERKREREREKSHKTSTGPGAKSGVTSWTSHTWPATPRSRVTSSSNRMLTTTACVWGKGG